MFFDGSSWVVLSILLDTTDVDAIKMSTPKVLVKCILSVYWTIGSYGAWNSRKQLGKTDVEKNGKNVKIVFIVFLSCFKTGWNIDLCFCKQFLEINDQNSDEHQNW